MHVWKSYYVCRRLNDLIMNDLLPWFPVRHYDLGANENELKGGELAESGAESPMVTPIEPVPKPKKDKKSNKKSEKKPKDAEKKEKKKNKRPKKKNDGVADETT